MSEPLLVIGIRGPAGSGKDTIARIMCATHGFTRVALADPIRSALLNVSGPSLDLIKELDAANGAEWPPQGRATSLRSGMQLLGTEAREAVGNNGIFVDLALTTIAYCHRYHPVPRARFVIPDVRFAREDERLREVVARLGGHYETWRVTRPDSKPIAQSDHASESGVWAVPADRMFINDRSIDSLAWWINRVVGSVDSLSRAKQGGGL